MFAWNSATTPCSEHLVLRNLVGVASRVTPYHSCNSGVHGHVAMMQFYRGSSDDRMIHGELKLWLSCNQWSSLVNRRESAKLHTRQDLDKDLDEAPEK